MHEYVVEYYPGGWFHCDQIDGKCGNTSEVYKRYKDCKKYVKSKTGRDPTTFAYNNSLWTICTDCDFVIEAVNLFINFLPFLTNDDEDAISQ